MDKDTRTKTNRRMNRRKSDFGVKFIFRMLVNMLDLVRLYYNHDQGQLFSKKLLSPSTIITTSFILHF